MIRADQKPFAPSGFWCCGAAMQLGGTPQQWGDDLRSPGEEKPAFAPEASWYHHVKSCLLTNLQARNQ
jgi:hypothetical protein